MRHHDSVVKNYASSALEVASEKGHFELVDRDVQKLKDLISSEKNFMTALSDEFVGSSRKLYAVDDIASRLEFTETTKNMLKLLVENKKTNLLPEIVDCVQRNILDLQGVVVVDVTVAREESQKRLSVELKKIFAEHFGEERTFEFRFKLNPYLMGGFVLTTGGYTFDASIKKKLSGLERRLIEKDF